MSLKPYSDRVRQRLRLLRCRWQRSRLKQTTVFAITGSCGKTNAAHFLGKILAGIASTHVSLNNNCQKALFTSMKTVRPSHRYLVQEVGVTGPGEMAGIVSLLQPDIGLVTTIGQDHYRNFRTPDATATEKGVLVAMLPDSGTAVLNADDHYVMTMAGRCRAKVITYGHKGTADVRVSSVSAKWPQRLSLEVSYRGETVRINTGLFGDVLVTSMAAAIAGAVASGVSLGRCAAALDGVTSYPGRLSIHRTPSGAWIVSDIVKAPFWSVEPILSLLRDATAPRKTIVIGSFSDTAGSESNKYRRVARLALDVADRVVFAGIKARYVRKEIMSTFAGRLYAFDSVCEASRFLHAEPVRDELVLVKSSILEHLERITCGIMDGFDCWENKCALNKFCFECGKSGLNLSRVSDLWR